MEGIIAEPPLCMWYLMDFQYQLPWLGARVSSKGEHVRDRHLRLKTSTDSFPSMKSFHGIRSWLCTTCLVSWDSWHRGPKYSLYYFCVMIWNIIRSISLFFFNLTRSFSIWKTHFRYQPCGRRCLFRYYWWYWYFYLHCILRVDAQRPALCAAHMA